jgi:hypothetical protein
MAQYIPSEARQQGRTHVKLGIPCQDFVGHLEKNGVSVMALSDGAGSAKLSHFGAEASVASALSFLADNFASLYGCDNAAKVKGDFLEAETRALKECAMAHRCDLSDLACTLLAVAISDDKFLIFHLGDGSICYCENGAVKMASGPKNGEFASSTFFLTCSSARDNLVAIKGKMGSIEAFLLMSDGTFDCFYRRQTKEFSPYLDWIQGRNAYLGGVWSSHILSQVLAFAASRSTMDDCSLGVMSKASLSHSLWDDDRTMQRKLLDLAEPSLLPQRDSRHLKALLRILAASTSSSTFDHLAHYCHLRRRYLQRDLSHLTSLGAISCHDGLYRSFPNE